MQPPPPTDKEALETAIVEAVRSSVTSAFAVLRTDVQQLDARFDSWRANNEQVPIVVSPKACHSAGKNAQRILNIADACIIKIQMHACIEACADILVQALTAQ